MGQVILGRAWLDTRFEVVTRTNDNRCRDPKCPSLKRFPCHFHDNGLACADPDFEGDSA